MACALDNFIPQNHAPTCLSTAARGTLPLCRSCCARHTPRLPTHFQVRLKTVWYRRVSWACSILSPAFWLAASVCPRLSLSLKICPLRSPSETTLGFSHHWLGPEIPVQESFSTFLPSLTVAEWWQDCPFYRETHDFIFPASPNCNENKKCWNFSCCSSLPSKSELRWMKLSFLPNFVHIFHQIVLVWCLFLTKTWKQSVLSLVC